MKIEEAITILKTHNEWRRGAEIPMTDPKIIGEAIDTVVNDFANARKIAEKSEKPTNLTWHKVADGDLPKDGQLVLISNPAIQFAIFNKLFLPVLRVGRRFEAADNRMCANVEYWMEIPEIQED